MKEKAFVNVRHNSLHLGFPNGNWISTIWGASSYSENHSFYTGEDRLKNAVEGAEYPAGTPEALKPYITFMQSDTCEVMIDCGEKLHKRLHKKYDGDGSVIGYLNIKQWLEIVNALASEPGKRRRDGHY